MMLSFLKISELSLLTKKIWLYLQSNKPKTICLCNTTVNEDIKNKMTLTRTFWLSEIAKSSRSCPESNQVNVHVISVDFYSYYGSMVFGDTRIAQTKFQSTWFLFVPTTRSGLNTMHKMDNCHVSRSTYFCDTLSENRQITDAAMRKVLVHDYQVVAWTVEPIITHANGRNGRLPEKRSSLTLQMEFYPKQLST